MSFREVFAFFCMFLFLFYGSVCINKEGYSKKTGVVRVGAPTVKCACTQQILVPKNAKFLIFDNFFHTIFLWCSDEVLNFFISGVLCTIIDLARAEFLTHPRFRSLLRLWPVSRRILACNNGWLLQSGQIQSCLGSRACLSIAKTPNSPNVGSLYELDVHAVSMEIRGA